MIRARAGGVTTVLTIPGSGNNMSGFGTIMKTSEGTVAESVIKAPGSLKIAQAGNPERYFYGVGRSFMNFNTRQTLRKARDYHLARTEWEEGRLEVEPAFNLNWEEFRPLFRRETVASVHTQIYQVLMTTVKMVAGEIQHPHGAGSLHLRRTGKSLRSSTRTNRFTPSMDRDSFTTIAPRDD